MAVPYLTDYNNLGSTYCSPCYGTYQAYQVFDVLGSYTIDSIDLIVDPEGFSYNNYPIEISILNSIGEVIYSKSFTDSANIVEIFVPTGEEDIPWRDVARFNLSSIGLDVSAGTYYFSMFGNDAFGFLTYDIAYGGVVQTVEIGGNPSDPDDILYSGGGTVYAIYGSALNGAVPEPATWAMMITGFGLVGASMRRRRIEKTISFG